MSGRILIASDGTPSSEGALRVGLKLAASRGSDAEVLAVLEPLPVAPFAEMGGMAGALAIPVMAREEDLLAALRRQLTEIDPSASASLQTRVGAPARTIAERATEIGADLIIMGTSPSFTVDRWVRSETSLKVLRLATVPVLLVPPLTRELPSSAVIALDFSDQSLATAHFAVQILSPGCRVHLVHVMWSSAELGRLTSFVEFTQTYRTGAEGRLDQIAANLRQEGTVTVDTAVLEGDAATEILSFATRVNADLIAAGSHGYGYFSRIIMGSVSTHLVKGAAGPVLIVPPTSVPEELSHTTAGGEGAPQALHAAAV